MKIGRLFLMILGFTVSQSAIAQWVSPDAPQQTNTEKQQPEKTEKTQTDSEDADDTYRYQAYLPEEVVPVVNGEVTWQKTFDTSRSDEENYQHMLDYLKRIIKEEPQTELARVALINPTEHSIVCNMNEWLVFNSTFISLDRTRLIYTLMITCQDGKVNAKAFRIHYVYEEQRTTRRFKAEEWITNEFAVNKKGTKLLPFSGKFRRKTVDRMNELMENIQLAIIN